MAWNKNMAKNGFYGNFEKNNQKRPKKGESTSEKSPRTLC